jgi:Protein of unknown function (DUF3179)
VWEALVDGRTLHFHLNGINNQNFIMRDEETGSWWQQVSGLAIFGPLKGKRLKLVPMDELSFALWRREHPAGRVLRPDPTVKEYESKQWEAQTAKLPLAIHARSKRLPDREIVIGISLDGQDKAYRMSAIVAQSPIIDTVGRTKIVLLAGEDGRSVRAFERGNVELFRNGDKLFDASGTTWDFSGRSSSGAQLRPVPVLKDFWFDWENYHPRTVVYGNRIGRAG